MGITILYVVQMFGWGMQGHRIVAQVAYMHLNSKAKKQVDKILGPNGIVYYSTWADEIKSDSKIYPGSDYWHYQDLPAGLSNEQLVATLSHYPAEGGNLWRSTDSIIGVLKKNNQDIDALKFIIHLVGDRFCPMHTGHLEDKGGNTLTASWFGGKTNLHSIWDSKIIDYHHYSYTEYATMLENTYSSKIESIENISRIDELIQNYAITEQIYEDFVTWNGNAYNYVYKWKDVLHLQLYRAGITLAKTLNEIYK